MANSCYISTVRLLCLYHIPFLGSNNISYPYRTVNIAYIAHQAGYSSVLDNNFFVLIIIDWFLCLAERVWRKWNVKSNVS